MNYWVHYDPQTAAVYVFEVGETISNVPKTVSAMGFEKKSEAIFFSYFLAGHIVNFPRGKFDAPAKNAVEAWKTGHRFVHFKFDNEF